MSNAVLAGKGRWAALGTLFLFLALVALGLRLRFYADPMDTDVYCYAAFGHELLQGRSLYSDLWDVKPPAPYVTFAAAEALGSYGRPALLGLNLFFVLAVMAGVFACGRVLSGSWATGLAAAVFWTLVSGDFRLGAYQPNTELFINAFLVWAFYLLLRLGPRRLRPAIALAIGALWGLATLYKQVPFVTAAFCAIAYGLSTPGKERPTAFKQVGLMAVAGGAFWLGVLGYFSLTDRSGAFTGAVFGYNFGNSDLPANLLTGFSINHLWPGRILFLIPLALLTVAGMVWGLGKNARPWTFLLAFTLAKPLEIALRGLFLPHYYQLWLPVLCIGAAWGLEVLRKRFFPGLSTALALATVLFLLWHESRSYPLAGEDPPWDKSIPFTQVVGEIDQTLLPGETFYEFTYNMAFYFEAGREMPVGVQHGMCLFQPPTGEELSLRTVAQLERSRPEMVIVDRTFMFEPEKRQKLFANPVYRYLRERYVPFRFVADGRFLLGFRKGGELEKRLRSKPGGLGPLPKPDRDGRVLP